VQVLCDFYNRPSNDPKVVNDAEGIFRALELENLRGEYKWSQLFKKDEIQTGRRVLLAYGLQFINQMGGVNIIVVSGTIPFDC
jgi:transcription factor IIIB subunit 2